MDLLIAFLSKTLNMDNERIADILYKKADDGTLTTEFTDNALNTLLSIDAERVKSLKGDDGKTQFDNGHKKGLKEALESLEREIRTTFPIESQSKGIDLIKEVVSSASKSGLTDDSVKLHPLFLAKEREAAKMAEDLNAEMQAKIADLQNGYLKKERFSKASEKIQEIFDSLKPVLPSNPTAASTQRRAFLDIFSQYDFDQQDTGDIVVKTSDGKRLENSHGHALTLAELVKSHAESRFDFMKQGEKGNSGSNSSAPAPGSFTPPKNEEEFRQRFYDAKTIDERVELTNWKKEQSAAQ